MNGALAFVFLMAPLALFAQTSGAGAQVSGLESLVETFIGFINNTLIPFVFALALLVFIWGLVRYFIFGGANEEKRKEGQQLMLWGIIGFFVMVSVWGLVNVLVGTFDFQDSTINLPDVPSR